MAAYRGIGPFAGNNKADGVLSVFATLHFFMHISDKSRISSLGGFELEKSGKHAIGAKKEIDLCLIVGDKDDNHKKPELIFCECKTYLNFRETDIKRMKAIGDWLSGVILVIATLNDELTACEKEMLTELVVYFRGKEGTQPGNQLMILTSREFLPAEGCSPLSNYEEGLNKSSVYKDFPGSLAELTVASHLGIPSGKALAGKRVEVLLKQQLAIKHH